jgi:hypothetical protein
MVAELDPASIRAPGDFLNGFRRWAADVKPGTGAWQGARPSTNNFEGQVAG